MASSEVSAVAAGGPGLPTVTAKAPASDGRPQPVETQTTSDSAPAVVREPGRGGETSGTGEHQSPANGERHLSADEADKVAENLKKAFSNVRETKLAFISDQTSSNHIALAFKVVDAKSGEVLSEFPARVSHTISQHLTEAHPKGLLVTDKA